MNKNFFCSLGTILLFLGLTVTSTAQVTTNFPQTINALHTTLSLMSDANVKNKIAGQYSENKQRGTNRSAAGEVGMIIGTNTLTFTGEVAQRLLSMGSGSNNGSLSSKVVYEGGKWYHGNAFGTAYSDLYVYYAYKTQTIYRKHYSNGSFNGNDTKVTTVKENKSIYIYYSKESGQWTLRTEGAFGGEVRFQKMGNAGETATASGRTYMKNNTVYGTEFDYLSERYLTSDEISFFTNDELNILRNSIYARKGAIFSKKQYSDYFSRYSWYNPYRKSTEVPYKEMNQYESKNIELLRAATK